MTWLIFGGTSGIGRQIAKQAAEAGFAVRAFGRSAGEQSFEPGIEPVKGDALNAEDVAAALDGATLVIQALGVKERPGMLWEEERLFSRATAILLPAMEKASVDRLITITGYGAGDSAQTMSLPVRLGHKAVLGRVYDDKSRQEELIQASDLKWTLVRPTLLSDGALSKRYKVLVDPDAWHMGVVSRADVAHFVVSAARDGSHVGEAVVLA